jgi:cytochrome P450
MLGIPPTHRKAFRRWTQAIIQGQSTALSAGKEVAGVAAEEQAFIDYIKTLIAEKRAHPDNSLTSGLVHIEEQGDMLNENELIAMIFLLITAGHEITVNLLGNGTLALLEHPEQKHLLQQILH